MSEIDGGEAASLANEQPPRAVTIEASRTRPAGAFDRWTASRAALASLVRRDAQALAETERGEAVQRLAPAGREGEACSQVVPMCRHPARCRLCHRNNGGTTRAGCARLRQPCGFSPSYLDHRDLRVGVLPQRQEITVGAFRLHRVAESASALASCRPAMASIGSTRTMLR